MSTIQCTQRRTTQTIGINFCSTGPYEQSPFGMPHPSLRSFLDWLQKCQYEVQCRRFQLLAGRPPKQQLPAYKKVDDAIAASKLRYNMNISALFVHVFPSDNAWLLFHNTLTLEYLSHISHLVGA